jgi:hypothetical protein
LGFAGAGDPVQRFNWIEAYFQRNPAIICETQPTIFKMSVAEVGTKPKKIALIDQMI